MVIAAPGRAARRCRAGAELMAWRFRARKVLRFGPIFVNLASGGQRFLTERQSAVEAAGPIEGTCIGNFIVQMIAGGDFADLAAARACVARSHGRRQRHAHRDPENGGREP